MRMLPALLCLLAAGTAFSASAQTTNDSTVLTTFAERQSVTGDVAPILWARFKKAHDDDAFLTMSRHILQNNARYNLVWMETTFLRDEARHLYIVPPEGKQDGIRAPASAAYGVAVLLQTGGWNETRIGVSEKEARLRAAHLIKGTAASYAVGGKAGKGWAGQWQSALWAALLGQAGWMLWADLDDEARQMVRTLVIAEADRFIAPGYKVPYWANPDGHINTPGDTKAEENAWNAMVLQVAVAMLPTHSHADAWKQVGSELMVSSFAYQSDLKNGEMRDGKPVKSWLRGFNIREDGGVINHNILHPDYMATPIQNLRSYLVQSLAGQTVPQTAAFNADRIYRALAAHLWPSPPYLPPGGTMYQPGRAEMYYPQKTDWSRFRFDIYYVFDAYANQFGWDRDLPLDRRAVGGMRVRGERLLAMQARFPDGRVYAPGEFDTYSGREQLVAWQIGDAYLLQWLNAHNALQPTGNWNKP